MLLILIVCVVILTIIVSVSRNIARRNFFKSKGIHYLGNGNWRLISNSILGKGLADDALGQYAKLKRVGKKVGVSNDFGITTLTVTDTEVLKSILVKDSDHFQDRREMILGKTDYIFRKMLFLMVGQKWKALRTKLSPTFTAGKIKRMFHIFNQSGHKFVKFIETEMAESGKNEIDLSQGFSKLTMDIMASAACGIESGAFNQKEASLFETLALHLRFTTRMQNMFKMLLLAFLPPKVSAFFKIGLFPKDVQDFFLHTIKGLIIKRQNNEEKRDDFVQLMLEARAGKLRIDENELLEAYEKNALLEDDNFVNAGEVLDDEGVVANALLFILAGYDTTQGLLLFCAYALALNQDVQEKLREEVNKNLFEENENGHEFNYDTLNSITYLDMVLNETLRLYPPAPSFERSCTLDYDIKGTNFVLKKGDAVTIPVLGLHRDPDLFPEPEKFDPERFSIANRNKINAFSFLPFGQGPRNCIGMRFALTEAKVVLSYLVHNFRIEPSNKTPIPIKFTNDFALKPVGGMHLRLHKI